MKIYLKCNHLYFVVPFFLSVLFCFLDQLHLHLGDFFDHCFYYFNGLYDFIAFLMVFHLHFMKIHSDSHLVLIDNLPESCFQSFKDLV